MMESERARCGVITYGKKGNPDWKISDTNYTGNMTEFEVIRSGRTCGNFICPLYGEHNLLNTLSVIALSDYLGLNREILFNALKGFRGVKRRQEIKGEPGGILILDDFAH
jgi:UDP-N-acetylmuramate-alanine ligase